MSGICPCDDVLPTPPTNLPGLDRIAFRIGTFSSFRRALLTPRDDEQALRFWRPGGDGDLAVMLVEWWAYLADILAFYNERIANQDYLRTADLPESVPALVALLGYRPRPAIGATGVLAALVTPGQRATLPRGLQFQSKPLPGQPPQIFELDADTAIAAPDLVPASAPAALLAPAGNMLLLQGAVRGVAGGALLLLRRRDGTAPVLASVAQGEIRTIAGGTQQTLLTVALTGTPPSGLAAVQARLDRANQSEGLWSFFTGGAVDGTRQIVHLAGLARQIRPGDSVVFTAPGFTPALRQVAQTADALWDATGSAAAPGVPASGNNPLPVPHTQIILTAPLDAQDWGSAAGSASMGFDWVEVGRLADQPPPAFTGTPPALLAVQPAAFPASADRPVLVQDSNGLGMQASGSSAGGDLLTLGALPAPVPPLQSPLSVLFNLLPVSRGQTVTGEILGSGDATVAGQSFALAKSPVTWLQSGAGYVSTVAVTVGRQPWQEVPNFYGQNPDAPVFVTREDAAGKTHVDFGDGVNGARLPTGVNNVVARYRIGAGADSPPAGKLTVIAQSWPGLQSVLNPVPVAGGADADPPDQIRAYAPRSVLTFGRAVSVLDYEAIAAQAPGVTRARAVWGWDPARQRALVRVFVGDDAGAVATTKKTLAAAGDPNRPVQVVQATAVPVLLALALVVTPGMDTDAITAGVKAVLADPLTGLFAPSCMPIGQAVFDSQIEAACLSVPGTVAIAASLFWAAGAAHPGPVHAPGTGAFYALSPDHVLVISEPDPNG